MESHSELGPAGVQRALPVSYERWLSPQRDAGAHSQTILTMGLILCRIVGASPASKKRLAGKNARPRKKRCGNLQDRKGGAFV